MKDLTKSGKLFEDSVTVNTLLVPAVFNYPVMDFALIGEHTLHIFQLTVGIPNGKIPTPGSPYHTKRREGREKRKCGMQLFIEEGMLIT